MRASEADPLKRMKSELMCFKDSINEPVLLRSSTADSCSADAERGEELWMLATHTGSTCQLVFRHSRGLVCLSVRVCDPLTEAPPHSTLPLHLFHPLFLPQRCPSCSILPITAASIINKEESAGPFYSCTCDCETHSQTAPRPAAPHLTTPRHSLQAATPSWRQGRDKLAEVHLCLV